MNEAPKIQKIAFIGDHLPRKCGTATFTSDLLAAVQSAHPESRRLAVSVNDIPNGYEYPDVVRFEVEEEDLSSYLRAADFLNISNVDVVPATRVRNLRWSRRCPYSGAVARTANASRYHASHDFA